MGPLTLESAALWGSMARDGERGAKNRAEIQKSISNLIALGGEGRKKGGQPRIPPLFYLKKQHFDLTLWHLVYISQFYWSFSLWQERLRWEQFYFQIQDHITTVSFSPFLADKAWLMCREKSEAQMRNSVVEFELLTMCTFFLSKLVHSHYVQCGGANNFTERCKQINVSFCRLWG